VPTKIAEFPHWRHRGYDREPPPFRANLSCFAGAGGLLARTVEIIVERIDTLDTPFWPRLTTEVQAGKNPPPNHPHRPSIGGIHVDDFPAIAVDQSG